MKRPLLMLLGLLFIQAIFGQNAILIKDINPGTDGSLPYLDDAAIVFNDQFLFAADNGEHGTELWISDGTNDGTQLLLDIYPGPTGSECEHFHRLGDRVIFVAEDPDHGRELWITDGTSNGTVMVKDLQPGPADGVTAAISGKRFYYVWNDVLYFPGNDGGPDGAELWRTDGTSSGTYQIKDLSGSNSYPNNYEPLHDRLYFSAESEFGRELWVTDGTAANTRLVKDIYPGGLSSSPTDLFRFDDRLLFIAESSFFNKELWISDGTQAGTVLLKEIDPSGGGMSTSPNTFEIRFHQAGDLVFFSADDGTNGPELWRTDGTPAGTQRVRSLGNPGGGVPQNFAVLDDILYYKYDDGEHGAELWRSDGTDAGTYMVRDIRSGFLSSFYLPTFITVHQSHLYLGAEGGDIMGSEVWRSDGTDAGTVRITDVNPEYKDARPRDFYSFGEDLIFAAYHDDSGYEWYRYGSAEPLLVEASADTLLPCYGDSSGSIRLMISGGAMPYEIRWENSIGNSDTLTNLPAGQYVVTISDQAGESRTYPFHIRQPEPMEITAEILPQTTGNNDGRIAVTVSGGTSPYKYQWDTGVPEDTLRILSGLSSGAYSLTVTDANGCRLTDSFEVDLTVGTRRPLYEDAVRVFPNPATEQVTISWDQALNVHSGKRLLIQNLLGQHQLPELHIPDRARGSFTLNVHDLAPGWYWFSLWQGDRLLGSGKISVL